MPFQESEGFRAYGLWFRGLGVYGFRVFIGLGVSGSTV